MAQLYAYEFVDCCPIRDLPTIHSKFLMLKSNWKTLGLVYNKSYMIPNGKPENPRYTGVLSEWNFNLSQLGQTVQLISEVVS